MKSIFEAIESASLELESERLRYRPQKLRDAVDIYALRSDPQAMAYMDSKLHHSLADSEEFIRRNLEEAKKKEGVFWMISEKASGQVIGDFIIYGINHRHFRANIGYMLKPDFWGKGYMAEALRALLTFGFQQLHIHSFEADINPENTNSRKVLEKVGFRKEAYFRESYFFEGKFLDSERYCLLERGLLV